MKVFRSWPVKSCRLCYYRFVYVDRIIDFLFANEGYAALTRYGVCFIPICRYNVLLTRAQDLPQILSRSNTAFRRTWLGPGDYLGSLNIFVTVTEINQNELYLRYLYRFLAVNLVYCNVIFCWWVLWYRYYQESVTMGVIIIATNIYISGYGWSTISKLACRGDLEWRAPNRCDLKRALRSTAKGHSRSNTESPLTRFWNFSAEISKRDDFSQKCVDAEILVNRYYK